MRSSTLPVASSLLVGASAQQKPLQVYLHPTPSSSGPDSPPTLSADQAKAVLAHHLGDTIEDFDEIPADESLWSHLMGMWAGEKVVGQGDKPRVVIIEGGVMPQDVLPSSIDRSPSFYLNEETSTRASLAPYSQRASHFLEGILHSIPALPDKIKDIFDFAESRAAAASEKESSCSSASADSTPWADHSKHPTSWEAISISGMKHLDRNDEVWETGRKGSQAGLESMTQPNSPPLLIIIVPDQPESVNYRRDFSDFSDMMDFAPFFDSFDEDSPEGDASNGDESDGEDVAKPNRTAEACYSSEDACSSSTTCFGRGTCALKSKNGDDECWGCKCSSGYAGVSCQKEDYSVPFIILVLSSVFLVAILGGSIALLYSVGETSLPSTLNLAIGNPKRD